MRIIVCTVLTTLESCHGLVHNGKRGENTLLLRCEDDGTHRGRGELSLSEFSLSIAQCVDKNVCAI